MKKKKWHRQSALAAAMLTGIVLLASCGKEETLETLDTSKYVTLGEYSGMTINVEPLQEITDEKVINYLNSNLLYSYAESTDITDRAVINGDTVSYECVGRMDGEIFEGGSTPEGGSWDTVIGSGSMIDGFEDGIIGMEIGETRDVVCTFPDPYSPNPDLSGKEAVFTITLLSITGTTYPELTTELLTEIGSAYATPEEAKAAIRTLLENNAQSVYDDNVRNAVLSAMLNNCEFKGDPPQFLVKENEDAFKDNILSIASMYGYTDMTTFVQDAYGMTETQFNEQVKQIATTAAQETVAMEALADAVGISGISQQELDAEAEAYIAESNGYYETIDALYEDVGRDTFRSYVISIRVGEWLTENNTIVSN
ncbi:MAG: FKBP-type peptidyl-prolyl cis-trans isomerase [bacterium]|nr:FKBP-type peptidyl-prolyl cis-trans isomerase [bacterium]